MLTMERVGVISNNMIISLSGPDTFRSKKHLEDLVIQFKKKRDPSGMNVSEFDAASTKGIGNLNDFITAAPFLAEKRLVIVKNLFAKADEAQITYVTNHMREKSFPSSTILVFWDGIVKPKKKIAKDLYAILTKEPYSLLFEPLSGQALQHWILEAIAARGNQISVPALAALVSVGGENLWQLEQYIEQLCAYAGDNMIEREMIVLFVEDAITDNIFLLVDAVLSFERKKAFELIRDQYKKGEDAQYIFSMLLRQCRILYTVKDAYATGMDQSVMAKQLKLHPFVVKKTLKQVHRFTPDQLKDLYGRLLLFDVQTKSSSFDQRFLLDMLVSSWSR